jgi:hypothetical protein
MLVQPQARRRAREKAGECRLANSERVTPQVVTVQLDQVEGVEEHARVVPAMADTVGCNAISGGISGFIGVA